MFLALWAVTEERCYASYVMWNCHFSPALTFASKHTSNSYFVSCTSINLFHIKQKRAGSHVNKTITLITQSFLYNILKFFNLSLSRTVVIVSGLPERNGNIGAHGTRNKLASGCKSIFESRTSTFQQITNFHHHKK